MSKKNTSKSSNTKKSDVEGIKPAVQRRILRFLNNAPRPIDISNLPGFEIDISVAKRLIEKRDKKGAFGFTDISQVADIIGINFRDLVKCFGSIFYGEWNILYDTQLPDGTPVSVAHAALLRTGWIMFFQEASTPITLLWDASDETNAHFEFPGNQPDDYLFCSGHSFLSDGRLLAAGGGGGGPSNVNRAWKFNPETRMWQKTTGDMIHARWYPTVITLGDERRVMVVGGLPNKAKVEIYDEYTDNFSEVTMPVERPFDQLYPGLHLLPGGEIFYSRTGFGFAGAGPGGGDPLPGNPYFKYTNPTTGQWIEIADQMEFADRVRGMSVLLLDPCDPPVRVMVVGGGSPPVGETAEIINLSLISPSWEMPTLIPGGTDRRNVSAVLLPDGTVFVCGGTSSPDIPSALYDPANNTWYEMDELNYRKQYHSVAILLPSGKVMATGGANFGGGSTAIELFSPPYLFIGARPVIDTIPEMVHHSDMFDLITPQAADIKKVVLVRPMAVTHQTDTEQRVIQMKFTQSGNTLHVTAPDHEHPHLAPRGYYMVFILNSNGVPSVGRFLFLH